MNRFLALLVLALTFCCAPATKDKEPPKTTDNNDWKSEDRPLAAESPRYASPPPPSGGGNWTRSAPAPRDEAPRYQPAPREQSAPTTSPPAKADRAEKKSAEPSGNEGWQPSATAQTKVPSSEDASKGRGDAAMDLGTSGAVAERERRIPSPQPDRPGLGTSWGETRSSSVTEVAFYRDASSPTYSGTLSYNDQSGALAMSQRDGYGTYANAQVSLGGAVTMTLRNEWGSTLSGYRTSRGVVAVGENGQRYTIVLTNNTNERFEVVLSVDGLDVLDGKDAGYAKRGYLIDAFTTIEVEGFRQSEDAVAAFRFGSVGDSYAARTGSARNVGVIGAAAFGERGYLSRLRAWQMRNYVQHVSTPTYPQYYYSQQEIDRRRNADPFPNKYANPPLYQAR